MHVLDLESQDNVDIYGDICLAFVQEPGGMEVWEKTKSLFFPMSREYVENRLADGSSLPPRAADTIPWFAPEPEPGPQ